ncbi:MAG: short chain dehydrogenase [Gemmatimonadaceae bacterium]
MRILIVGATGIIGQAVVAALRPRNELILASRTKSPEKVDLTDQSSIRALFERVGKIDAVVSVAGEAAYKPLPQLSDQDFAFSVGSKLMGQINLVRLGATYVNDGGSFTLTSGVLATRPTPGGAAISVVNAGVDAFARAAALELPRGIRINSVSPPWVSETLVAMGRDPSGGLPAADVARSYAESVEGKQTGTVITPKRR